MILEATDFCEICKTREIQNEITKRGVTRLCHMTSMRNLISILYKDTGILANDFMEEEIIHRNDPDRMDGKTDYISTSIQYPNVWYYRYRRNIAAVTGDWVVIFIDTDICRSNNTLFSPVNAAKARGAYLSSDINVLVRSFSDMVNGRLRTSNMLKGCPTDDQAEIMIYKEIPVEYFKGIAFESRDAANRFTELAHKYGLNYPDLYVAPDLFTTQMSRMIRLGIEPEETRLEERNSLWQKDLCS